MTMATASPSENVDFVRCTTYAAGHETQSHVACAVDGTVGCTVSGPARRTLDVIALARLGKCRVERLALRPTKSACTACSCGGLLPMKAGNRSLDF